MPPQHMIWTLELSLSCLGRAQERNMHAAALAAVDLVLPPSTSSKPWPAEWAAFCEAAPHKAWLQGQLSELASCASHA